MATIESLRRCPLFAELYDNEIESILNKSVVISFAPNKIILNENAESSDIFIVLHGHALVSKKVNGKDMVVAKIGQGEVFGESALLKETHQQFSLTSRDDCDILVIDNETIFSLFDSQPKIFSVLLMNTAKILSKRLYHSKKFIKAIYSRVIV
jgi:CRP/FNR family cyclic AMP-dependent transcriptional regulator